jgi:hypothetical protein
MSKRRRGIELRLDQGYWTPPLSAALAYRLEKRQIEDRLGLQAMVSLSDHDNIEAPLLLRVVAESRTIPVSVEWSAPFGPTCFHLGVHNIPSSAAVPVMNALAGYTAHGPDERRLTEILEHINTFPTALVVFNHPLWDLYGIGYSRHEAAVECFLQTNNRFLHALELNGLRTWNENLRVAALAGRWGQLVISGGDRHGCEPNANLNLTQAATFNDFVQEVRCERKSHVLFMPQYQEPLALRIMRQVNEVLTDYQDFPQGSQCWHERVFHPDAAGVMRSLAELWPNGLPAVVSRSVAIVKLLHNTGLQRSLRRALPGKRNPRSISPLADVPFAATQGMK